MKDFNFEYDINTYSFECLSYQSGVGGYAIISFYLYNINRRRVASIAWEFDSSQDLNDFMVRFVKENFKRGYRESWQIDFNHEAINESYSIESGDCAVDFPVIAGTDCFPKLKEALTKHYCPELLQDHSVEVTEKVNEEIVLNGVKYRRIE
jgi:hypothetical protein